jgi:hypothetical protein
MNFYVYFYKTGIKNTKKRKKEDFTAQNTQNFMVISYLPDIILKLTNIYFGELRFLTKAILEIKYFLEVPACWQITRVLRNCIFL